MKSDKKKKRDKTKTSSFITGLINIHGKKKKCLCPRAMSEP